MEGLEQISTSQHIYIKYLAATSFAMTRHLDA